MKKLLSYLTISFTILLSSCTTTPMEEVSTSIPTEKKCSVAMELTMEEWIADVEDRNPLIPVQHSILKGDKVTTFMAAFNATPPESNYAPDTIVIFVASTDPRGILGFAKDGCMLSASAYPLNAVASWVKGRPFFIQPPKKIEEGGI